MLRKISRIFFGWFPLGGILLFAAWSSSASTALIFVALVPLLWLDANTPRTGIFFAKIFINLLVWNLATTWWIWNASPGGAVGAILANSVLMCYPWMLYRFARKRMGATLGYATLVCCWLAWEYLHQHWDLSWPWLTLGNVFAMQPKWVNWYQFTGTTGGSLWVLLVNILLYNAWFEKSKGSTVAKLRMAAVLALAILPALPGLLAPNAPLAAPNAPNVVVVQPNIEPYTEKFSTDPAILIANMIALAETQTDSNTRVVVWPETAIPTQVWEHDIATNAYYQAVFDFCERHPALILLTGIDSYRSYGANDPQKFSARQLSDGSYYEAFNTAMSVQPNRVFSLYHKSKLVPGVETLPSWLGFLGKWFDEFGGISGSLGKNDSAVVFSAKGNPYTLAPIICYESIYSDYVTEYVKRGANLLTIITNDGWWGKTPGYIQHMNYARLRAIENGLWVARSANTGISCFISPTGEVIMPQAWNTKSAIKLAISPTANQTFYAKHGDWISRMCWPLAIVLLIAAITTKWWRGAKTA